MKNNMADLKGVEILQKELLRAQAKLKNVDEKIKKHTGQDPSFKSPTSVGRRGRGSQDARPMGGRLFSIARRDLSNESEGPPIKRRAIGGAFGRLGERVGDREGRHVVAAEGRQFDSGMRRDIGMERGQEGRAFGAGRGMRTRGGGPMMRGGRLRGRIVTRGRPEEDEEVEDPSEKPALQSSIVPADTKSREDVLEEQGKDERSKSRNKRMFGALLGTLQRFKTEEKSTYSSKEKARHEVEKKLEQKAREEKEEIKRKRRGLYEERKNKQNKLKQLEQKMELVKIHDDWVKQTRILMNFIRTKTKPYIFYIPKSHTTPSKKKLLNSQEILEDVIEARRQAMEEELQILGTHEESEEEEDVAVDKQTESAQLHEEAQHSEDENMDDSEESARVKKESNGNITHEATVKTEPMEDQSEGSPSKQKALHHEDDVHEELDYEHESDEEPSEQQVPNEEQPREVADVETEEGPDPPRVVEASSDKENEAQMPSDNEQGEGVDTERHVQIAANKERRNRHSSERERRHSHRDRDSNMEDDGNVSPSEHKSKKSSKSERKKAKKSKHKRSRRSVEEHAVRDDDGSASGSEKDERPRKRRVEVKDAEESNQEDNRTVVKGEES